jgi:predicted DNA-binding protein (MmcQ/YjbR family)
MTFEFYREYCLKKPFVSEGFPFDKSTHVLKVGGKMFALSDIDDFTGINLKADPERSIELRERYMGINPGWHMNKTHWNTVNTAEDVSDELLLELIDHSYQIVYHSLPKKVRNELEMG